MATAQELQDMRAALVAARSTGALRTTFRSGGTERTTEYKSDRDMASALAAIDAELASITGQRIHTIQLSFERGD
jgi:hypothetical protein